MGFLIGAWKFLTSAIGRWVAAAAAVAVAVAAVFYKGRASGEKSVEADVAQGVHEDVEKANAAQNDVASKTPTQAQEEIQKWDRG